MESDVAPTGNFQFQRKATGDTRVDWAWASFETLRTPHSVGIRFFKLDSKTFTFSVKKGFFRTPGLPARIEVKIPSVSVAAAVVGVANHFGYGPFTTFPLSHHSEPFMPGDRTCNGGAYTFQIPGALAVADTAYGQFDIEKIAPGITRDPAATNRKLKLFYMSCGTEDPRMPFHRKALADFEGRGIKVAFAAFPDAHEWKVWRYSLADLAPRLFR